MLFQKTVFNLLGFKTRNDKKLLHEEKLTSEHKQM